MAELNFFTAPSDPHPHCLLSGQLICKDIGYALHCKDGPDLWLEMESIPQNLIERDVFVTGRRYGGDLVWVEAIGPLETV